MAAITFDSLSFVKTIENSGVSRAQAEAIAKAVSELRINGDNIATREDILTHERELSLIQQDIASIKSEMATKHDLKELELRMTIKLGAMIMALGGILIAVKFLG